MRPYRRSGKVDAGSAAACFRAIDVFHGSGGVLLTKTSPTQLNRARRLLAHEGAADSAAASSASVASRVYDKLLTHMAPLVGDSGVHLLFVRSALLARGEFDWLAEVSTLEGSTQLREYLHDQKLSITAESAAVLFGNFFTLMTIFVGERLVTQVLRVAWPAFEEAAIQEKHK